MKSCLAFLDAGQLLRFKMEPCVGTDNLPQNRCGVLCSRRKEYRKSYSSSLPETLLIT